MNTAGRLQRYCEKKHIGFPSQGFGASKTGKLTCLRAHGVGVVEARSVAEELESLQGILSEVRKDESLDRSSREEFTDYLIGSQRRLKKAERLGVLKAGYNLSQFMSYIRRGQGLGAEEAAQKCGMSVVDYISYEKGTQTPSDQATIEKLATGLNTSPNLLRSAAQSDGAVIN